MGYEITEGRLFGGGGDALEELVAKSTIGAEALAGRSREDAGPSTVRAGLFGVDVGTRLMQLHQVQRLDRLRRGWSLDRLHDGDHVARRRLRRRCPWCF